MFSDLRGFRRAIASVRFTDEVMARLPGTIDCFAEALFFADQLAKLPAAPEHEGPANWLASAHFSAVIAIRDAGKADFNRNGMPAYKESALAREFVLSSSSSDPEQRDPLAVNRAYRDLRNLRVHHARRLLDLRLSVLEVDLAHGNIEGSIKYHIRPIEREKLKLLSRSNLIADEVAPFNEWVSTRTATDAMYQHLHVLQSAIERTAASAR